jgi:hypothetical protein
MSFLNSAKKTVLQAVTPCRMEDLSGQTPFFHSPCPWGGLYKANVILQHPVAHHILANIISTLSHATITVQLQNFFSKNETTFMFMGCM